MRGAVAPSGRVETLEGSAAREFGTRWAMAVGSGREALALVLRALELGGGDEVLLPALTFHAVPETIRNLGFVPVFVDVEADTLQMDAVDLERKVSGRSRVVIATHLLGHVCDIDGIGDVCRKHGLTMVEDFAQAAGARHHGRPVGSFGRAGFTSLETVKTLSAFGGGLATTSDEHLAREVRAGALELPEPAISRLAGKVALGHVEALLARPGAFSVLAWPLFVAAGGEGIVSGYKRHKRGAGNQHARLHPAQAAACLVSLEDLAAHVEDRRRNADRLLSLLPEGMWRQRVREGDEPAWYQFVVRVHAPEHCARACLLRGIDVGLGVVMDVSEGECTRAAGLAREVAQLPCHPWLREEDLVRVSREVEPWLV